MANRRSVLIGLGGLVAGGGALLGTGAFTTVEAERTVNVQTAGDASAFLGLTPARDGDEFVSETDGTIQIDLDGTDADADGLNQNAKTTCAPRATRRLTPNTAGRRSKPTRT